MDLSKTPAVDTSAAVDTHTSRKTELGFFILALVLVAALGAGFALAGIGGLAQVMIVLVPVCLIVLVMIAQGK